MRQTKNSDILF